jgi:hypothetical protein
MLNCLVVFWVEKDRVCLLGVSLLNDVEEGGHSSIIRQINISPVIYQHFNRGIINAKSPSLRHIDRSADAGVMERRLSIIQQIAVKSLLDDLAADIVYKNGP